MVVDYVTSLEEQAEELTKKLAALEQYHAWRDQRLYQRLHYFYEFYVTIRPSNGILQTDSWTISKELVRSIWNSIKEDPISITAHPAFAMLRRRRIKSYTIEMQAFRYIFPNSRGAVRNYTKRVVDVDF